MRNAGKRLRRAGVWATLAAICAVVAPTVVSGQGMEESRKIREDFDKGVAAFNRGDYEESLDYFDQVIGANPSNELALELRERAGFHFFVKAITGDGDPTLRGQIDKMTSGQLATILKKMLQLAERGEFDRIQTDSFIEEQLKLLQSSDYHEQFQAMERLNTEVGEFVVPFIVETLTNPQQDVPRARVVVLLKNMGHRAVLPLLEVLESSDPFTRQNVVMVLGHIQDPRSMAHLRAISENSEESPEVRDLAILALNRIERRSTMELEPAEDFFYRLARAYYLARPEVMVEPYVSKDGQLRRWVVWEWNSEIQKLEYRLVDREIWNDELAEELCYRALDIDPESERIWSLLLNVYANQQAEVDEALHVLNTKVKRAKNPEEAARIRLALNELNEREEALAQSSALVASRGKHALYQALRMALIDDNGPVAVRLIEALQFEEIDGSDLAEPSARLDGYLEAEEIDVYLPEVAPEEIREERREPWRPAEREPVRPRQPAEPEQPTEPTEPTEPAEPEGDDDDDEWERPTRSRRTSQVPQDGSERFLLQPRDSYPIGASLSVALDFPDKRVRYAAAIALAHIDPRRRFANDDLVMANLRAAVTELSNQVVLVVIPDTERRNRVAQRLRDKNYVPFLASTGFEGLDRAKRFPAHDLVIVDHRLNPPREAGQPTAQQFLQEMLEDYRTSHIPIMVIGPADAPTQTKLRGRFKSLDNFFGVLPYDISAENLHNELNSLLGGGALSPTAGAQHREEKGNVAARAAAAIASVDPETTVCFRDGMMTEDTVTALREAITRQPNQVKVPALRALGVVRGSRALQDVRTQFNENTDLEVRKAAAWAIGEIASGGSNLETIEGLVNDLRAGLAGARKNWRAEQELYKEIARALGKLLVDPERRRQIFVDERLE